MDLVFWFPAQRLLFCGSYPAVAATATAV
eukprot:COSAG03_NODE_13468_length_502_cov_0.600496_1_plen_28_part_01